MAEPLVVMICRSARKSPIARGYVVGEHCAACREPLQVTPAGVERAARDRVKLFCNPCGLAYAHIAKALGQLERTELGSAVTPEVLREYAGHPLLEFLRSEGLV